MKRIIGLTGQTGAGKSTLAPLAEKYGFEVIDCDKVARSVTAQKEVLNALVKAFSAEILNSDKTLNRAALARKAFASKERTELLNSTVLPFIKQEIICRINKSQKEKILLDAPTLFESGINGVCEKTVGIVADRKIRLKRIMKRDGIEAFAAEARISAGKTEEFFQKNCDFVLCNNQGVEELREQFENILKNL